MPDKIVVLTMTELTSIILAVADEAIAKALRRLPSQGQPRPFHVTQKQAAEMLSMSPQKVGQMVKFGTFKLNSCGLIPISQIDLAIGNN